MLSPGDLAPDWDLPGSDGRQHALRHYRGQKVLLYFYPKDDTPGCTKEACGFRDLFKDLSDLGVTVLGVSSDSLGSHQNFIEKYSLPFVLLSDEDRSVMTTYGAWGEKMMYGKKVIGVIRSSVFIGEDGAVIRHWAKVPNAEKHPASVVKTLVE